MSGRFYTSDTWPAEYTAQGFTFSDVSRGPPFNADLADRVYNAGIIAGNSGFSGGATGFFGQFNTGSQLNQGATDVLTSHGVNSLHYSGNALDFRTGALNDADKQIAANAFGQAEIPGFGTGNNHFHLDIKDRQFQEAGSNTNQYGSAFRDGRNGKDVGDIKSGQGQGQNPSSGAAAGAGGGGGGAACASAMISGIASIAMGGLMQGLGLGLNGPFSQLTSALNQIPGVSAVTGALQQATGMLSSAAAGLTNLTSTAFNALGTMGASILPGLSNVIPSVLQTAAGQLLSPITNILANPLSLPSVVQQFTAAGGLSGFLTQVGTNMVGNFVGGTIANLTNNLMVGTALSTINRNIVGGVGEAMQQVFGNGVGGLGESFRNVEGMITYGVSTLGNNLGAVAANMIATGSWDTGNLTRLMQPGEIAQQIVARGLGDITGLNTSLISAGIPLAGINNPIYDGAVQKILNNVTSFDAINAVKSEFAVATNIANLGDLTDITKMMPDVAATLPVASFEGLGKELINLQITNASTLTEIGSALTKIESGRNLNHISQLNTPMHKPTGDLLLKTFGFGSGTYGETSLADFMGTPAGIVHNDTLPVIIENINFVHNHPEAQTYYDLIDVLNATLRGDYTTPASPGDPTGSPPVPATPGGITPPAVGIYTFSTYATMDDALIQGLIPAIEDALTKLKNTTDTELKTALEQIDMAHTASIAQVFREAHLAELYEINFLEPEKMTPIKAYMFAKSLEGFAEETGYGQAADIIERLATNDLYGDAIKATMRQHRNARILDELGVNTERLKVPSSTYYRDPLSYIGEVYNGYIPDLGTFAQPVNFATDPVDKYVIDRDAALFEAGYIIDELTAAEKDELYMDIQWQEQDSELNRQLGERVVSEAINRNIVLLGENMEIVALDKSRVKIATITPGGLIDYDYDQFLSIMFSIVNKILYGNIGTTKINTPFSTEEIVYAVAEQLGNVNSTNIDLLLQTQIGSTILGNLLTRLANKFGALNTINDTRMDRNDPSVYGGVGPGTNPNIIS